METKKKLITENFIKEEIVAIVTDYTKISCRESNLH